MPEESEVAAFSGSTDTGARKAAAALVIQEAYRMYRHRQAVKVRRFFACSAGIWPVLQNLNCAPSLAFVLTLLRTAVCLTRRLSLQCTHMVVCIAQAKMRYLRTSRLWRNLFQKWVGRAREQLRLRREALAVVAMEKRRKRYQADAQQRLAWVDEGLAQHIEDHTCPVCCADAGQQNYMRCSCHLNLLKRHFSL